MEGVDIRFSRIDLCQPIYLAADRGDDPLCQITVYLVGSCCPGICIFRAKLNIDCPITVKCNNRWYYIRLRQGNRTAGRTRSQGFTFA
ncbi:hypothetical protein D3C76_1388770 [compost metagenome]